MLPIINRAASHGIFSAADMKNDTLSPRASGWFTLTRSTFTLGLSLAACAAGAADLGALRVLSAAGDPLRAEIAITSYTPEEAGTLQVKLAPPEIYRQSQVDYQPALSGLQLSVDDRPNGRKVIQVSSAGPVDARVLDLLVDLTWNMGRFIRQYSFVLDAPLAEVRAPVVAAQPLAPLQVAPGETLFDIARRVQPEGATVFQTLLALFHANPQAFVNGNMNQMMAGATLNVPGSQVVLAEDDAQARRSLLSQSEAFTLYRQRLAQAASGATPIAAGSAPGQSAGAIESPNPEPAPAEPKGDELKLSNDGTAQSDAANSQAVRDRLEEEKSATEKAIQESESRVKELQENIAAMRSLLESQNQTLAGMEQRAGNELAAPPVDDPVVVEKPPEPAADGYAAWVNDRVVAIFGGLLALLAVILSVFAMRRRSREETAFDSGYRPGDDAVAPSLAVAPPPAPAPAATDDEDDEYGDDEGPMNRPMPPIAPIAFGFDLDLDKPPSDEPSAAPSTAAPAALGRTQPPLTAPVAPAIIPPVSEPLEPPITPVAAAPMVTPPATPAILPELAPARPSGLTLDTDIGVLPDSISSKLDLAKAYIDIGDRSGARDLLNEVVNTGDIQQRHRARDLLATL